MALGMFNFNYLIKKEHFSQFIGYITKLLNLMHILFIERNGENTKYKNKIKVKENEIFSGYYIFKNKKNIPTMLNMDGPCRLISCRVGTLIIHVDF